MQPPVTSTETTEYIKNLLTVPKPSGRPRGRPKKQVDQPIESLEPVDNPIQVSSTADSTAPSQKRPRGRPKKEQPLESLEPIDEPIQEIAAIISKPYNLRKNNIHFVNIYIKTKNSTQITHQKLRSRIK